MLPPSGSRPIHKAYEEHAHLRGWHGRWVDMGGGRRRHEVTGPGGAQHVKESKQPFTHASYRPPEAGANSGVAFHTSEAVARKRASGPFTGGEVIPLKSEEQAETGGLPAGARAIMYGRHDAVLTGNGPHDVFGKEPHHDVMVKNSRGDWVSSSAQASELEVRTPGSPELGKWAVAAHEAHSHNREAEHYRDVAARPASHIEPPPYISNERWIRMSEAERMANLRPEERRMAERAQADARKRTTDKPVPEVPHALRVTSTPDAVPKHPSAPVGGKGTVAGTLKIGSRVHHPEHGEGSVMSISGGPDSQYGQPGDMRSLRIHFDSGASRGFKENEVTHAPELDLTGLTPAQVDERWSHHMEAAFQVSAGLSETMRSIRRYGASVPEYLEERRVQQEKDLAQAREASHPFDAEYKRRGGWPRYLIVANSNGHVHRSPGTCSSLHPGRTLVRPIYELSGETDEGVVGRMGHVACTKCFPNAPVLHKKPKRTRKSTLPPSGSRPLR